MNVWKKLKKSIYLWLPLEMSFRLWLMGSRNISPTETLSWLDFCKIRLEETLKPLWLLLYPLLTTIMMRLWALSDTRHVQSAFRTNLKSMRIPKTHCLDSTKTRLSNSEKCCLRCRMEVLILKYSCKINRQWFSMLKAVTWRV